MILTEIKQTVTKVFSIDYENGITCKYITTNDNLTTYSFNNSDGLILQYISTENIPLLKSHWSDHYKLIETFKSINNLKLFTEFDNLFYIGGHHDGMLRDKDGNFLSSVIRLDSVFCQCWLNIEKKKKKCQKILDSLKSEYVLKSNIVYIESYNHDLNKHHHHTLELSILLPDDLYRNFLGNNNSLDDDNKVNIFNFLKNIQLVNDSVCHCFNMMCQHGRREKCMALKFDCSDRQTER